MWHDLIDYDMKFMCTKFYWFVMLSIEDIVDNRFWWSKYKMACRWRHRWMIELIWAYSRQVCKTKVLWKFDWDRISRFGEKRWHRMYRNMGKDLKFSYNNNSWYACYAYHLIIGSAIDFTCTPESSLVAVFWYLSFKPDFVHDPDVWSKKWARPKS